MNDRVYQLGLRSKSIKEKNSRPLRNGKVIDLTDDLPFTNTRETAIDLTSSRSKVPRKQIVIEIESVDESDETEVFDEPGVEFNPQALADGLLEHIKEQAEENESDIRAYQEAQKLLRKRIIEDW